MRQPPHAMFHLRDSHPLRSAFPDHSTTQHKSSSTLTEADNTPPQHRTRNACQLSHAHGLAILRFRSPLLTEYLLLRVLRCFTSPRSPQHPMNSGAGNQTQLWPGSPIRTPSDHSSFANSPRHIAGYNVLLRPLVPRHPPNALKNLQHTK